MIATVANEKGVPMYHLDVSQAFIQAPLKEKISMRLPLVVVKSPGKSCGS